MEKYLGVKLIEAESQDKPLGKNDFGEGEVETFELGYKVRYEDGYESWSPKDVFEKAYRRIKSNSFDLGYKCKEIHQIRVYEEADELENKIIKLNEFINSNNLFPNLPKNEQIRLKQQLMAMQYYLTILVERMENF